MALRKITNTVAVDTAIMASGDVVNSAILEFKNVVTTGITAGRVLEVTIIDPDHNSAANLAGELWLFTQTVSQAASNAAHSISDADALFCEAILTIGAGDSYLSALNSVSNKIPSPSIPFNLPSGTSLFGILVTRAAPTFAGGTITVVLQVES